MPKAISAPFIVQEYLGVTFCIQTEFPHYIGRLMISDANDFMTRQIKGYRMCLKFKGTLSGNYIGLNLKAAEEVMTKMADWFWINQVLDKPAYDSYKE